MKKIAIIYGSDTGNTKSVAERIAEKLKDKSPKILGVENVTEDDFAQSDMLFLGTSTWGFGELQSDWDTYYSTFQKIDFNQKRVALFGVGDCESYSDSFVSAMKLLYDVVIANGGTIIGQVETDEYNFNDSDAVVNAQFVGLPLDEDNEPELTEERIDGWLKTLELV